MMDVETPDITEFVDNNNINAVNPATDEVYRYDAKIQEEADNSKPWRNNPTYFKRVEVSAVALMKMVTHACSGGDIEIMGMMQGKIKGDTMYVMDAFALPVEGTETRVSAQEEGYEYMVDYVEKAKKIGRHENVIGWYHSHPGYRCWLSGIDVRTQMLNQQYQDPFLAVVIDPKQTVSTGKVDIGAFRTYPENYEPSSSSSSSLTMLPTNKASDFGAHASKYYSLEISYFRSLRDAKLLERLWRNYWVKTLSQSPLVLNKQFNTDKIVEFTEKIKSTSVSRLIEKQSLSSKGSEEDGYLSKLAQESELLADDAKYGLMTNHVKHSIFNFTSAAEAGQ
ncbi:COP9 signalosome catalytic subunit rri1 [Mycoemilia scoparia]|uniref:COP9 signalosome complex subunit 5 n=1 Tax=Mycoemilia scoparia TaxID=417184 RepID=A0A9W8DXR2_9FUNG|nr:COP9 signalosome catalytic subunit rri1 [Mycoemilia scoparia]